MNAVVFLFSTIVAVSMSASTTRKPTGCMWQGQWYPDGAINHDPCQPCHCYNGQVACAVVDCFFTMCVDAVHDAAHCCPTCPNGPNCRAPDGTIIPANGTVYHQDATTTCTCDRHGGMGFGSLTHAVCSKTIIDPAIHVVN